MELISEMNGLKYYLELIYEMRELMITNRERRRQIALANVGQPKKGLFHNLLTGNIDFTIGSPLTFSKHAISDFYYFLQILTKRHKVALYLIDGCI